MGINRYIVGCKSLYGQAMQTTGKRINRYIVGCKFCRYIFLGFGACELIDTQWDVNNKKNRQEINLAWN